MSKAQNRQIPVDLDPLINIHHHANNANALVRSAAAHADIETKGLAQETLTGLHGTFLLDLKLEKTEDSSAHDEKFHLSDVASNTGTGAVAERNESGLLAWGETVRAPALGDELIGVRAPDILGMVDSVRRDGEYITRAEGVTTNLDGRGTSGNLTGKTHGGGAVDTHSFPDHPLEVIDILDHGVSGDLNVFGDSLIESLV
jgi:hypothetical protein